MMLCIDTETTGLNPYLGHRAFLITWCFEDGKTGHCRVGIDDMTPLDLMLMDKTNEIIGHNLGFDLAFLAQLGMQARGTLHNTLIAAHLFNPLEPTKRLKELAKKYLGRENTEEQKLEEWFCMNGMRGKDNRQYIKVPEEIIIPYALADVSMTMELWKFYKSKGITESKVYKFENELIPVVMDIVKQGMKVDREFAKKEAERTTERVIELATKAKIEFDINNLGSDDEIGELLFKKAGLSCLHYTEKGNPQLDDIALQDYDHPIVPIVREYRDVVKINSTYLQPMLLLTDKEDVLHASLNQTGARTGRFSSSNPNLQNIPRSNNVVDIRRGFICRSPFHKLLLIDLSQIELRVLAHYTQEKAMVEALQTREGDLHAATADLMFGSHEKKFRTIAKTLNFAIIYGAGPKKLQKTLAQAVPEMEITLAQTKQFKADYFDRFPKILEFMQLIEGLVRKRAVGNVNGHGFVTGLSGRNYFCEADKTYRILNYLIQGESAMFFKKKMLDLSQFLSGRQTRLVNVIHDEMILDFHREEEYLLPEIVRIIEDKNIFRVPIYANVAMSDTNWAEKVGLPHPLEKSES